MSNNRTSLASQDRKTRYRELLEDLSTLEDVGNNEECMEKTAHAVKEAQNLLAQGGVEERVKNPGEGYLDSRVLRATSDLALRCSEAITSNVNTYDKHELAQHIKDNLTFWDFMFPFEAPPVGYMFGAGSAPPPPRTRVLRPRAPTQTVGAMVAPQNVDRLEKTEEGSEMVSRVNKFINKKYRQNGNRSLSYFNLVIDPSSFSATVENVYRLSFLVRDGAVSMHIDEETGVPMVTPVPPTEQSEADLSDENQFIVSMDMKMWKDLTQAFKIKEPMMVLRRD